jgi:glucan phosphoethanolaminetransferase (alkaline phosphatase superfamily)
MFQYVQDISRGLEETEKREPPANLALSYIGNIFSLVYFITPLIQIIKAYKIKFDKNDIPLSLLVLIILNCLLWLINAFSSDDLGAWIPLLISNGTGIVVNVALLFLYLNLLLEKNWKQFIFYGIFTLNVIAEISYFMFRFIILADKDTKSTEDKENEFHTIGFVATVINVMMYSSTFFNIIKMMKNKDADKLIIFTIGIGLLCTIMFMVQGVVQYSYYDRDNESNNRMYAIETMVSNGLSFLSLAIQGGIWLYYFLTGPKGTLKIDETLEHLDVSADTTH